MDNLSLSNYDQMRGSTQMSITRVWWRDSTPEGDTPLAFSIEGMGDAWCAPTEADPAIEVGLEYVGSGDDDRLDGRTLIDWRGDLFLVQTIDLEYDS